VTQPRPDLRWDDLQVFLMLCECSSLTAAARRLDMHPSTAQRRLGALENALGLRLFERSPSGLVPTAAGERMQPLAARVEGEVESLVAAITGEDQAPRGTVHLTAPEPLLSMLMAPLAAFRDRFPEIDLQVSFSDRFFDLAGGEADVAVRPSASPPADSAGRRIGPVAWAVYQATHPRNDEAGSARPWARFGAPLERLSAAAWWQDQHGDEPVLLTVNSVSAMHRVVAASRCQGLLPCFVGDADPMLHRTGGLIPATTSDLWILVHPDRRRTTRVRALLDHLWDALSPQRELVAGRHPSTNAAAAKART